MFISSRMFTEDWAISKSTKPYMENEALLGSDGAEVTQWVGLDDKIHHGHLLLMRKDANHHQWRVAGQMILVKMVWYLFHIQHHKPSWLWGNQKLLYSYIRNGIHGSTGHLVKVCCMTASPECLTHTTHKQTGPYHGSFSLLSQYSLSSPLEVLKLKYPAVIKG